MKIFNRWTGELIIEVKDPLKDLSRANLSGAYLSGANLSGANLSRANLSGANLSLADLSGAYLSGAYLSRANLSGANLSLADLSGAYLSEAYLSGANLKDVENFPPISILPEGDLIGWKKCEGKLVKLLIPAKAKRVNSTGRKCRAEYVKVLEIQDGLKSIHGDYDHKTVYRVGRITRSDKFDDDIRVECSHGIHFFITKEEAENYN